MAALERMLDLMAVGDWQDEVAVAEGQHKLGHYDQQVVLSCIAHKQVEVVMDMVLAHLTLKVELAGLDI
jgi:hypothetical protein